MDAYNYLPIENEGRLKNYSIRDNFFTKIFLINNLKETKDIKDFHCAEALESFYEDDNYVYYWSCIKNEYMIVKYENGYEETISNALKNNTIKISDLDDYNISYIKETK